VAEFGDFPMTIDLVPVEQRADRWFLGVAYVRDQAFGIPALMTET
jgi:hypothetical protein